MDAPSSPLPHDAYDGVRAYARSALGSVELTLWVMGGTEHRDGWGLQYTRPDGTKQCMDTIITEQLKRIKIFLLDVLLYKEDSSEYDIEEILPTIVKDLNEVVADMHGGGPLCYGKGYFEMKRAKQAMADAATELFQQ